MNPPIFLVSKRGTLLAPSLGDMMRLHVFLAPALLALGSACGGDAFTSERGSGSDDSSSAGGTSSDSASTDSASTDSASTDSASSDSASSDSTSSSDGSGTRSASSTSTTSSSGGSGGNGGSAGSGTGGSGGSVDGTGGSNSTDSTSSGGTAGSGGNGGCALTCELDHDINGNEICSCKRPEAECETDADCVLASNRAICCSGCVQAMPKELVDSQPCLMSGPDWVDADCEEPNCTNVLCPAIACEQVRYAACEDQRCVGKYECPEGTVFDHGYCVPPCEGSDECAIAYAADSCCGGCPVPVNREVLEQNPCMVPYGEEAPEECQPDPNDCSFVGCPDILCLEPGEPVCAEGGVCGTSSLL